MKYTIKAIKRTAIPKKDGTGTWNKLEVKTNETGELVYEIGQGFSKDFKDSLKSGQTIAGYLEDKPWFKTDGSQGGVNKRLNGITAEYVYDLLLKVYPGIEIPTKNPVTSEGLAGSVGGMQTASAKPPVDPTIGWDMGQDAGPVDDIGF